MLSLTRWSCDTCHPRLCPLRPCLQAGIDRGPFTPGRGYTGDRAQARAVCLERHLHGCPRPLPEPDVELARCCPSPHYLLRGRYGICRACGERVPRWAVELLRGLEAAR